MYGLRMTLVRAGMVYPPSSTSSVGRRPNASAGGYNRKRSLKTIEA
jgi:hypothetical protein